MSGERKAVLEVRVEDPKLVPTLTALCAGYERGEWRKEHLIDDLINWLPEFALTDEELKGLTSENMIPLMRRALSNVYKTDNYKRRGELGELLLHAVLRQQRKTLPAINKLFFKDGANETVKGFDAVHVVEASGELELWLGEVKFYEDINAAIRAVLDELKAHTETNFLRSEFLAITNKIDSRWTHATKLKLLLDPATSLDAVFARTCIPVLLTYDSPTVAAHTAVSDAYVSALSDEVRKHHERFAKGPLPGEVRVELFLVPLLSKADLNKAFDERLKQWQTL